MALPRHGSCVLGQRPPYFALSGATFPGDPLGQAIGRLSGVSSPGRSASELGSVVLDDRWTHLRGGAFVVKDKETEIAPLAHDRERERRLWEATSELLKQAVLTAT